MNPKDNPEEFAHSIIDRMQQYVDLMRDLMIEFSANAVHEDGTDYTVLFNQLRTKTVMRTPKEDGTRLIGMMSFRDKNERVRIYMTAEIEDAIDDEDDEGTQP